MNKNVSSSPQNAANPVNPQNAATRTGEYPPLPETLVVPVYDNHTHLDIAVTVAQSAAVSENSSSASFTYTEHLDRASSVGIRGVVQVGTDVETSQWAACIAATEPRVLAAVAIHPNDAPRYDERGELDDALDIIAHLATQPRVVAVGETGLDFFRTAEQGRDAQIRSFEAHIDIAKRYGLALQIHDRDAHEEVVRTLLRVGAPERTVFHCFSGDAEFARLCAEHGWYMSFAGNVTFKNAQQLRHALASVPRSLLLIETDAPFLTPEPFRGRPNAPYLLPYTLRAIAEYTDTQPGVLAAQITSNTHQVYGHWDAQRVTFPEDVHVIPPKKAQHFTFPNTEFDGGSPPTRHPTIDGGVT